MFFGILWVKAESQGGSGVCGCETGGEGRDTARALVLLREVRVAEEEMG